MTPRRGLTLVELLVALTVTAVTMSVGWSALGTIADRRERARAASTVTVRAANVRRQVVAWLEGAHVTGEEDAPPFQVTDHASRGRPDDELSFLTSATTPLGRGDVGVRLYVDRDPRTAEQGLVAAFADRWTARTMRVELDPSVVALEVRCRSDMRGRTEWLASWLSGTVVPQGVELTLAAAGTERLAPLLRVPIVVAIAGGR